MSAPVDVRRLRSSFEKRASGLIRRRRGLRQCVPLIT